MSLIAALVLAATIRDDARGFSFEAPKGYERAPQVQAPTLYLFTRGTQGSPDFAAIQLVDLGATLARETQLKPDVVEASARKEAAKSGVAMTRFEYKKTHWQGFELDLVMSEASFGGNRIITLATQVPLASNAVQLQLAGQDEAALSADLQTLLGSLVGESNWLTEAQRDRQLGERTGRIAGLVVGVAIAVVAMYLIGRRRRP